MNYHLQVIDICIASLALYVVGSLLSRRTGPPLPPGPPARWPLLGNLLDFPVRASYKVLAAMTGRYGPIIYFNMLGTPYVVLNSFRTTRDLLHKKSAITSNRQPHTMADLVGWNRGTFFLKYGDTHRKHRKFFHQQIGSKNGLEAFSPVVEAEVKWLLRNVLRSPDDLDAHARRMLSSVMLKVSHGYSVKERDDPFVEMANIAMRNFAQVTNVGFYLVDTVPILRCLPEWFPGAGFLKDAKRWRKVVSDAANMPHQFVLDHLDDAAPSFTSRLLQEGVTPQDEEILKWASFSMYLGGSDTTPSTLMAFFLAMTIYPDVLRRAQKEVDAVAEERLPTLEDRHALPYVNAICKELLRWNVVIPLIVHITSQDQIYDGYFIPKGTYLFGNIWSILSDAETYPDPEVFNPERFLGDNPQPDPHEVCFGWGRRSCPGAHLVDAIVFITVAITLATLDVSRCVESGVEHIPNYRVREGVIRHVKPFKFRIAPRSTKPEALLQG